MPVLRNVYHSRQPGRFGKQRPVVYDGDGWTAWPSTTSENINYRPNIESLDVYTYQASFLPSLGLPPIPQFDQQYSHSCQQEHRPLISSDGLPYHPPTTNASSPREGYTGRREPGHIPRPRNAFIIFRSSYIFGRTAAGEGPQNQLSKQAGEVWKGMSDDEKEPYTLLADVELRTHQEMYPNYIYCPRRGPARMKGSESTIKGRDTNELTSSSTPLVSPKSTTPETASAAPTLRPLHAAAQLAVQRSLQPGSISPSLSHMSPPREDSMQENLEVAYPEPNPPAKMDVVVPKAGTRVSQPGLPIEDDFVPTADIPELELSPPEEPKHEFDLSMRPSNLNVILEQFGLKYHNDSTTMLAHLPPMPNLNDTASTEDSDAAPCYSRTPPVPSMPYDSFECSMTDNTTDSWQPPTAHLKESQQPSPDFSSYLQTPSNVPITPMSSITPLFFSTDGNTFDCYQQQSTNGSAAPQLGQPAPGFTLSSDDQIIHDDPMSSEGMMLEDDFSFLSYLFDLTPLNDPFFGYAMY